MKLDYDKKMFKYCLYIIVSVISIFIGIKVISNLGNIFGTIIDILTSFYLLIKPLFIALIIAYLLYPLRNIIEKFLGNNKVYKIKKDSRRRALAVLFSYVLILGLIVALICGIYFMIGGQLSKNTTFTNIISDVYNYFSDNKFSNASIKETIDKLDIPFIESIKPMLIEWSTKIQHYVLNNIGDMTSSIMSIGSSIVSFFIGLVISIYLLKDTEYFVDLWKKIYNIIFKQSNIGINITKGFSIIHETFSKFLRGQLFEALLVGILSSVILSLVGIDYAIIIGIISGICNMIPYIGPIVGTVLAGIMGLLSGNPIKIVYAIISMIIVQQLDNNLFAPKIVGDSVGLHPVFIMLAILIGGNIGGLFGMLLAVPLSASIKIFFNMWYDKKFHSADNE